MAAKKKKARARKAAPKRTPAASPPAKTRKTRRRARARATTTVTSVRTVRRSNPKGGKASPKWESAAKIAGAGLVTATAVMLLPHLVKMPQNAWVRRGAGVAAIAAAAVMMRKRPDLAAGVAAGGAVAAAGLEFSQWAAQYMPSTTVGGLETLGAVVADNMGAIVADNMGAIVTDDAPAMLGMGTVLAEDMGAIDLARWDEDSI